MMKKLFAIACAVSCVTVHAAEPVPPSTAYTRTLLRAANAASARTILGVSDSTNAIAIQGGNGNTNTFTNLTQRIINPVDGTGMAGSRLGSGVLWQSTAGENLFGFTPSGLFVYTNLFFNAGIYGNFSTATNANATTLFGSGTVPPARLGSGSGGATKFLREDSTFQTIAGGGDLLAANNLSDVASAGQSRTNLGANNGSNITAGIIAPARLGSGSGGTTKFLREDATFQTVSGIGDFVLANNNVATGSNYFANTFAVAGPIRDSNAVVRIDFKNDGTELNGVFPDDWDIKLASDQLRLRAPDDSAYLILTNGGRLLASLTELPLVGDPSVLRRVAWSINTGTIYWTHEAAFASFGESTNNLGKAMDSLVSTNETRDFNLGGSNNLATTRMAGPFFSALASNSTVIAWAGKSALSIFTNQSFTLTASGTVNVDQRFTLSISNSAASNIVATFPFNVSSVASGQTVSTVTIPASSLSEYDLRYNGSIYVLRDVGINNANLASLSTNNATALTNINAQTGLLWPTNAASTVSIAVSPGGKYSGLSTNNNLSIAGVSGIDASGTNVCWGSCVFTNNSVGAKTISIPAAWIDVGNYGSTTIYNTNQGWLSVVVYPGFGTNFLWRGK